MSGRPDQEQSQQQTNADRLPPDDESAPSGTNDRPGKPAPSIDVEREKGSRVERNKINPESDQERPTPVQSPQDDLA